MQSVSKTDIQQDIAETPSKKISLNAIKSGKIKIYTIKSSKHWDEYVLTLSFNGQFAVLHPVITAQNADEVFPQLIPILFNDDAPTSGRLVSASHINKKPIWAYRLRHAIKEIENEHQGIIPTIKQQFKAGGTEFKQLTEWMRDDYGKQLGFLNKQYYTSVIDLWYDLDHILSKSQSNIVVDAMKTAVEKFSTEGTTHLDSVLDDFRKSLQEFDGWDETFKNEFYNKFYECSQKYCNQPIDGFSFGLIDFRAELRKLFGENTAFKFWCGDLFSHFSDANKVSCALTNVKNSYGRKDIEFTTANETAEHILNYYNSSIAPAEGGSVRFTNRQTGSIWEPDPKLVDQLPAGGAVVELVKSFDEAVPDGVCRYFDHNRSEFYKILLKSFCKHLNIDFKKAVRDTVYYDEYLYHLAKSSPDAEVSAQFVDEVVKIVKEYLTTDGTAEDEYDYTKRIRSIKGIARFCETWAHLLLSESYKYKLQITNRR